MAKNKQKPSNRRPMVPEERRRRIAQLIGETGSVMVATLEKEFGVSAATARRDLQVLERAGQARRTHGGAVVPGFTGHEDSFEQRLGEAIPAKKRLAKTALSLLGPGETVFIDSSTTAYYAVQRILAATPQTTFLTNLLPAMEMFKTIEAPQAHLIGIGGSFRVLTKSFVGPQAIQTINAYFADKTFLSVKGLTPEGDLTDPDPSEAEVKRAMIKRSETPVLLVDGRKFERRGLGVIANISAVALVITADAGREHIRRLTDAGVDVRCV